MADKKYIEVGELKEWIENFFEVVHYYHPYSKSRTLPESELLDILERMPAADVAEVDEIEKALLERCRYNAYGGLTKVDVVRELAKFRRKDNG